MRSAQRLRRRHAVLPAAAVAVTLTFGLSACTSTEQTADAMHSSVVQIAERAVAGDFVGALAELELLDRDVTVALDTGRIEPDREQGIRAAIELVRADLEAALAAATPPPAPAAPDDGDDDGDDGNSGNGNGNGNGGNSGNGNGGGSGSGESTPPPATTPPVTQPPATEPPATEPPATEPPATEAPSDEGEG